MSMVGQTGETRDADDAIVGICEQIREEIQNKTGKTFHEFKPLKYRTQLVNGMNYFIKVHGGGGEHLHVRVHKSFQGEVTLSAFQVDKTLEDELVYFQ